MGGAHPDVDPGSLTMPERSALLTALILERPLCMECLSSRVPGPAAEVQAILQRLDRVLPVQHDEEDRCRACGAVGGVWWLERPSGSHQASLFL